MKNPLFYSFSGYTSEYMPSSCPEFDAQYKQLDSLSAISRLVYHTAINPQWTDSLHFTCEIRDKEGLKGYKVNVSDKTKEPWTKEKTAPERGSALTHGFPGRQMKEVYDSPDGKWEAFIKDHNIWLREKATKEEAPLSYDGTENLFYSRIYWSPDSKKIAAIQTQDAPKHRIPLLESAPADQKQPKLQWRDYYKPGDLIPVNRPALFHVELKQKIEIDTRDFSNPFQLYIRKWADNSQWFSFEYNQRGHQAYQVVHVDATSGQARVIVDERFDTFVHYDRNSFIIRKTGKSHLVFRKGRMEAFVPDRCAYRQVKKQLTRGEWVVRQVIEVKRRRKLYSLYGNGKNAGEDPYNQHYYRMRTDGSQLIDLTPENATHRVNFSPDNKYFTDIYSRPDMEPVSVVRSARNGSVVMELGKADIADLLASGWARPEVFSAKGRDGITDIWGTIYRPSFYNPAHKYPLWNTFMPSLHAHSKDFGGLYALFQNCWKWAF
jgi:dipeptidyl aminopeptidase/acylaminoacyl peptidase